MSSKDRDKLEWLKRYKFLNKKIKRHKRNANRLKSEISNLEIMLGYK